MDFEQFIRKPFKVEAVQITEQNIDEVAHFVGTLSQKEDGSPYIRVNRRLIPNVDRVYPGFWLTRMGDNYRCYSGRAFLEQFVKNSAAVDDGVKIIMANREPPPEAV